MKRVKKVFHYVHNHTSCVSANDDKEYVPIAFVDSQFHVNLLLSSVHVKPKKQKLDLPSPFEVPHGSTPIPASTDMDHEEFRRRGKEMIDFIADYLVNIG